MGKMTVTGLDEFSGEIATLGTKGKSLCKYALYGGAKEIADAIKESIGSLPDEPNHYVNIDGKITNQYADNPKPPTPEKVVISPEIKSELQKSLGISKMSVGSKVEAVIGFAGYSSITTKKYSSGLPLQMIAGAIESGSSVRQKKPFVRPAVNKTKAKAQKAMADRADEFISRFKL